MALFDERYVCIIFYLWMCQVAMIFETIRSMEESISTIEIVRCDAEPCCINMLFMLNEIVVYFLRREVSSIRDLFTSSN